MDMEKAKKQVCRSGIRLLEQGLVARTWGNVSCRLDHQFFVITPSGIQYDKLTPHHIPRVNMQDQSWEGNFRPSSEKGLHARIYRERKEVHAVIHTHQSAASCLSVAKQQMPPFHGGTRNILGEKIGRAPYALPGTKKLEQGVIKALGKNNAVLLANHGVVCVGENLDGAFTAAMVLETVCEQFVLDMFAKEVDIENPDLACLHRVYLERVKKK